VRGPRVLLAFVKRRAALPFSHRMPDEHVPLEAELGHNHECVVGQLFDPVRTREFPRRAPPTVVVRDRATTVLEPCDHLIECPVRATPEVEKDERCLPALSRPNGELSGPDIYFDFDRFAHRFRFPSQNQR
jgi:hypothetical protein